MFAVMKTGGKQYRVATEDVIRIDRVNGQPGEIVEFGEVLVVGGDTPQLGTPTVAGATVAGEVLQRATGRPEMGSVGGGVYRSRAGAPARDGATGIVIRRVFLSRGAKGGTRTRTPCGTGT